MSEIKQHAHILREFGDYCTRGINLLLKSLAAPYTIHGTTREKDDAVARADRAEAALARVRIFPDARMQEILDILLERTIQSGESEALESLILDVLDFGGDWYPEIKAGSTGSLHGPDESTHYGDQLVWVKQPKELDPTLAPLLNGLYKHLRTVGHYSPHLAILQPTEDVIRARTGKQVTVDDIASRTHVLAVMEKVRGQVVREALEQLASMYDGPDSRRDVLNPATLAVANKLHQINLGAQQYALGEGKGHLHLLPDYEYSRKNIELGITDPDHPERKKISLGTEGNRALTALLANVLPFEKAAIFSDVTSSNLLLSRTLSPLQIFYKMRRQEHGSSGLVEVVEGFTPQNYIDQMEPQDVVTGVDLRLREVHDNHVRDYTQTTEGSEGAAETTVDPSISRESEIMRELWSFLKAVLQVEPDLITGIFRDATQVIDLERLCYAHPGHNYTGITSVLMQAGHSDEAIAEFVESCYWDTRDVQTNKTDYLALDEFWCGLVWGHLRYIRSVPHDDPTLRENDYDRLQVEYARQFRRIAAIFTEVNDGYDLSPLVDDVVTNFEL